MRLEKVTIVVLEETVKTNTNYDFERVIDFLI